MLVELPRLVEKKIVPTDYQTIFTVLGLIFLLFIGGVMYSIIVSRNEPDPSLYATYHEIKRITEDMEPVARFPEKDYFRWERFVRPWGMAEASVYDNRTK
jgi:hypothetical protein